MAKKANGMNAAQAMRLLLAEGLTDNADIIKQVKDRFGLTVNNAYVASFKSNQKKKQAEGTTTTRATQAAPAPEGKAFTVEEIKAVKALPDRIKELVIALHT